MFKDTHEIPTGAVFIFKFEAWTHCSITFYRIVLVSASRFQTTTEQKTISKFALDYTSHNNYYTFTIQLLDISIIFPCVRVKSDTAQINRTPTYI